MKTSRRDATARGGSMDLESHQFKGLSGNKNEVHPEVRTLPLIQSYKK